MMKTQLIAVVLVGLTVGGAALARAADVVQRGDARVIFNGKLSPRSLPRSRSAPVRVDVSAKIESVKGHAPPPRRRLNIAITRHGNLNPRGRPTCSIDEFQPATTQDALAKCGDPLVGTG